MSRTISRGGGVVFFCKFPPPYTGMTIGTQSFSEMVASERETVVIDTAARSPTPGRSALSHIRYYLPYAFRYAGKLFDLARAVRAPSVDTLYIVASPSLHGHISDVLAVATARRHVDHVVAHVHNGNFTDVFERSTVPDWLVGYFRRSVDRFVFSSTSLSERCADHLPASKRTTVHNTVDERVRCTEAEIEEKIRARTERKKLRIVFLSNMIRSKGYGDVAEAAAILRERSDLRFELDYYGAWNDAGERREFEERLEELELNDVATVHGPVTDRSAIKELLLEADVFVLPTYYPREAQPFAIVEAMNAGTPVISTRHVSIPEYVHDGRNGYLVSKRSPDQIADAVSKLADASNWARKARAARTVYENQFSPADVKRQILAAIAMNRSGPKPSRESGEQGPGHDSS